MKLLQQFKCRYHGSKLADIWHRWAPPITLTKQFFGVTVYMDLLKVHERQLGYLPVWDDVPHYSLGDNHVLYATSDADIELLTNRMQMATACSHSNCGD